MPTKVEGPGDALGDSNLYTYEPQHSDWYALYAYPLAEVTAVGMDLPCTVAVNAIIGVPLVFGTSHLLGLRKRSKLHQPADSEIISETD